MNTNTKNKLKEILAITAILIVSASASFGRFMEDSLRFDEAMEYMISHSPLKDMYSLIITTYQPPLYNFVMHIWLLINDSVIWFKLSNVFFYSLGTLGLIWTVRYIVNSYVGIITAVIVQFCFSAMLYYSSICGEYVLVLAILYWLLYFTVKMIYEKKLIYFILWDVFAVLSIGTQYGAMFTIFGTGLVAFIIFVKNKDFKSIKYLAGIGIVSVLVAVVPLYVFFTTKQMNSQEITQSDFGIRAIYHGIIDAMEFMVFSWHTNFKDNILKILILSMAILAIIGIIRIIHTHDNGKVYKALEKHLTIIAIAIIVMITYVIGVASGKYAYGLYSSRHTVLVLPIMITLFGCLFGAEVSYCIDRIKERHFNLSGIIIAAILAMLSLNSVHYVWYEHWNYDQIDTALAIVNEIDDELVWIHFMAVPTTIVYDNKSYSEKYDELIKWWVKGENVEYDNIILSADNNIESDFGGTLPSECVVLCTDMNLDVIDVFDKNGYFKVTLQEVKASPMADGTFVIRYTK